MKEVPSTSSRETPGQKLLDSIEGLSEPPFTRSIPWIVAAFILQVAIQSLLESLGVSSLQVGFRLAFLGFLAWIVGVVRFCGGLIELGLKFGLRKAIQESSKDVSAHPVYFALFLIASFVSTIFGLILFSPNFWASLPP